GLKGGLHPAEQKGQSGSHQRIARSEVIDQKARFRSGGLRQRPQREVADAVFEDVLGGGLQELLASRLHVTSVTCNNRFSQGSAAVILSRPSTALGAGFDGEGSSERDVCST